MGLDYVSNDISLDKELDTTGYSYGHVLKTLHQKNKKFVQALGGGKVEKVTARDISDGKGYLSRVYKTTVHFSNSPNTYGFVMKIPTVDCLKVLTSGAEMGKDDNDLLFTDFADAHDIECDAYELIKDIKDFPLAEIFYTEKMKTKGTGIEGKDGPGVIMMEDVSVNATTGGLYATVTHGRCLNVAKHFAQFQSFIRSKPDAEWKGRFVESFHISDCIDKTWPKYIAKCVQLSSELKESADQLLSIDLVKFAKHVVVDVAAEKGISTFIHGDVWSNNFMVELGKDGSLSDTIVAFLDWQCCIEGNPLFDLARCYIFCTDTEIRREHETQCIDLYYETLTQLYKKQGHKVGFTRSEAQELYELACIHQCYELLMGLAFLADLDHDGNAHVHEARTAKLILRAQLNAKEACTLMKKHGIFEKFGKNKN